MTFPFNTVADFPNLVLNTFDETKLESLILETEKQEVRRILSDKAYVDILADTSDAKYTELVEGVTYTDSSGDTKVNDGLKKVLQKFIEALWNETQYKRGVTGRSKNENDNTEPAADNVNTSLFAKKYNEGIRIYCTDVVPFIVEKTNEAGYEGYEDFNLPLINNVLF